MRRTQPVEEETVSCVRKGFRATAEARKRPPLIAEAMVDADMEIPCLIQKGKLLTPTTEEALKYKASDFRGEALESVLQQLGLAGAQARRVSPNWAEGLVRFLTDPVISSLLMILGMLGISWKSARRALACRGRSVLQASRCSATLLPMAVPAFIAFGTLTDQQ